MKKQNKGLIMSKIGKMIEEEQVFFLSQHGEAATWDEMIKLFLAYESDSIFLEEPSEAIQNRLAVEYIKEHYIKNA